MGVNTPGFTQLLYSMRKKANAQIAHLVFADTRANAEKTKRAIFLPTLDRNI